MFKKAHGSFAFSFEKNYTLISASDSWNIECTNIYEKVLKKRMKSDFESRRCVIIDGRDWGFETPESSQVIRELNRHVAGYYKTLYIAYYLSEENFNLAKFIIDSNNEAYEDAIFWQFFLNLEQAVSWLNSEGFTLPDLENDDFPVPIHASYFLKYL